jgi:phosphotransferase system enzyme I (PtsI)
MAERFTGMTVSPGVAVGRVHLLRASPEPVVPRPVPPERIDDEIRRFHRARETAAEELGELKHRVASELGGHFAGILEAQRLILEDPLLIEETVKRIRVGRVSARWALREVVGEFERRFDAVDDAYIRERGSDLADVHRRLQEHLLHDRRGVPAAAASDKIVVAPWLMPTDVMALTGKGIAGLAADVGGKTSHTSILAQALGVPAVAGLVNVSRRARPGTTVILDAERGEVVLNPDAGQVQRALVRREEWLARERGAPTAGPSGPALTRDGVEIALRANVEFADDVGLAVELGAAGVGLYRSEFLFVTRAPALPDEDDHHDAYLGMARRVAPHPVIVRTLDLGGEKSLHEVPAREESNPALGLRGIRLCLKRPDIFRPQIRGLLRAAAVADVRAMLPLVTCVDEVRSTRKLLAAEAEDLRSRGIACNPDLRLGVMVEVPAAALAADLLAAEVDFFSIGTNDLIQYALAVDRSNESVNYLYRPLDPGFLRLLVPVVAAARKAGIPVSVCGEMGADPESVEVLIGLGLREFSVQPRSLSAVRRRVAEIDTGAARSAARGSLDGKVEDAPGAAEKE